VAALLDRPAVLDQASGVAAIGAQRSVRKRALDDLQAPDFVLPDLNGTPHALSDHRSKKRLLVAFSSW
ncbi:MAG: TlpA family protein disulfide reductase, partial [Acidimicrobiaceae bacterium]|nr:TlpA family protein disulfide reductase [Acidimicrobiaceae bacterium]